LITRFLLLALTLHFVFGSANLHASLESDYQLARDAVQKGKSAQFAKIAATFPDDHLLTPYIRYWQLKADMATDRATDRASGNKARDSVSAQQAFIRQYADSPLSNRLRTELARKNGIQADWSAFLANYAEIVRPDQELLCLAMRARQATGDVNQRTQADSAGIELWRTARDLPSSCEPIFDSLAERGLLTLEDRLARLRLALDDGNLRLARELDARLPDDARMLPNALNEAKSDPASLIAAAEPQRAQREVALYALTQMAKNSPEEAANLWQQQQDKYAAAEQAYGWGQIGLHAARRHDSRAMSWFLRAGRVGSELQATWKARAALRAGQWIEVFRSIEAMPEATQNEAVWRYWKARSLKAMNAHYPANVLFAKLSREIHYYGLLAEEELPAKLEARPADYKITPNDLKAAETHIGLQRALLLRRLGDQGNALEEWNWALRGMDDRSLLAAAELARREEWYDRAIATAERTRDEHDFDLRYLAPYRDLASAYAQENELDEAWVFGLMRQESRFIDYARSSVGAQGLMQIMPATAKWISRQLGLGKNAHAGVGKPETNIRFGTYYLKHIYDSLGQSPVMATAGYNAGPGRARRWQAETPLEGAIYVENIPFFETREYVKKVLTNAMFYRNRFGGVSQPLKERLGVIPAHPNAVKLTQSAPLEQNRAAVE
jgi:soluble lytic murein transglycosylase